MRGVVSFTMDRPDRGGGMWWWNGSSCYWNDFFKFSDRLNLSLTQSFANCVTCDVVTHVAYACIWKQELTVWRRGFCLMTDTHSTNSWKRRYLYSLVFTRMEFYRWFTCVTTICIDVFAMKTTDIDLWPK